MQIQVTIEHQFGATTEIVNNNKNAIKNAVKQYNSRLKWNEKNRICKHAYISSKKK